MNLTLDFGNTFAKAGIFEGNDLREIIYDLKVDNLPGIVDKFSPEHVIISSVSIPTDDIKKQITTPSVFVLRHDLALPFTIDYKTPETLGLDRIAAVAGAQGIFPKSNCLVIDGGTCFTYDLIDHEGVYHGGSISPGINQRLQALYTFTANLPLVEFEKDVPLTGQTTKEAIQSGVLHGIIGEINEIIRMYSNKFANLQIIICGGDAKFFENKLKASIFAVPELVLRGLNKILLYNA